MEIINQIKSNKGLLFIIGLIVAITLSGKDTNYWGLKDKSGLQILKEVEKGYREPFQINLTENQEKEISDLVLKSPEEYSAKQKVLTSKKTGEAILSAIETRGVKSSEVILNAVQYKEITTLIKRNPDHFSSQQTILVKEKTGEEILNSVGLGTRNPKSIILTAKQRKEIKQLISKTPTNYNENQKSLVK